MKILQALSALLEKPRLSVDEEILYKSTELAHVATLMGASVPADTKKVVKPRLLTTSEIIKCYGNPGDPDNHVVITLPYPFRIAWDLNQTTNRVSCHKKIADRLMAVFNDLLAHYGAKRITELGIDLFGGLGNFRPQRGLEEKYKRAVTAKQFALSYTYLSRHSWWIAIDLDPARNQLKQTARTAQFAKPNYAAMQDIFYAHGFIGYGRERNNDYMHFEIGVLID